MKDHIHLIYHTEYSNIENWRAAQLRDCRTTKQRDELMMTAEYRFAKAQEQEREIVEQVVWQLEREGGRIYRFCYTNDQHGRLICLHDGGRTGQELRQDYIEGRLAGPPRWRSRRLHRGGVHQLCFDIGVPDADQAVHRLSELLRVNYLHGRHEVLLTSPPRAEGAELRPYRPAQDETLRC